RLKRKTQGRIRAIARRRCVLFRGNQRVLVFFRLVAGWSSQPGPRQAPQETNNTNFHQGGISMKSAITSLSFNRRAFLSKTAAALSVVATSALTPLATANDDRDNGRGAHWVASWATSPAAFFVYTPPVVQNQALAPAPARFAQANIQPDLA